MTPASSAPSAPTTSAVPGRVAAPTAPGGPRAAVQIDRADLDDFQRAARLLLAHPLITDTWPTPTALPLVRRWEAPLRAELQRVLGYRLDIGRSCARLYRRSAVTSVHRGAFTRTGRPLGPLACSFLCLTLAGLEGLGEQTTASRLADEVLRLRAGDDDLPVDLTRYDQRKAFVDAVTWLEERGVLGLCDGTIDRWLADAETGDALYDIDRDAVSRLLVASPSVLRDVGETADFLVDPYPDSDDGRRARARHRLGRRLVTEPVLAYEDLDPDELAYARQRRARLSADLERLTGCTVEARAEGLCLVDAGTDRISAREFPAGGTEVQAALLWGAGLVEAATARSVPSGPSAPDTEVLPSAAGAGAGVGAGAGPGTGPGAVGAAVPERRVVPAAVARQAWDDVVASHGPRFKAAYRDAPDRLRAEVLDLLDAFGLATGHDDGSVEVAAALARYRPLADEAVDPPAGAGRARRARPAPADQLDLLAGDTDGG